MTRRTIIKLLVGTICMGLATLVYDIVIEGPSWYLEGREPDRSILWDHFVKDCGHQS